MTSSEVFAELQSTVADGGVPALLEKLAAQMLAQGQFHELFEARKMQIRHRLGLPLLYSDSADELDDDRSRQLEEGLYEACREVGTLLLQRGRVREGWAYLRPVGDKATVATLLADVEVDDDNMDEIVEVALHEAVDPARGYQIVLDNYGTCNAITTFEQVSYQLGRDDQQAIAALLLRHVHDELKSALVADITAQEGAAPAETTLAGLVADRDWLFGEHSYHIDTTHLASTVRFARTLTDEASLRLALDLTEYGRRLSDQFQYQDDEPFADIYPSNALFFQALLGENVDEALAFFRQKAETVDAFQVGTMSIEVYVDLLARLGRYDEAIDALINLTPENVNLVGRAPSLFELSTKAGHYDQLLKFCQDRNDVLGYATALAHA